MHDVFKVTRLYTFQKQARTTLTSDLIGKLNFSIQKFYRKRSKRRLVISLDNFMIPRSDRETCSLDLFTYFLNMFRSFVTCKFVYGEFSILMLRILWNTCMTLHQSRDIYTNIPGQYRKIMIENTITMQQKIIN